ncbi:immunoglobulin E-set, partial [Mrakia frigida]|uniref:Rdi1p n=1 Tax=Mrakia frigida TaxID=29902 RepID=UPI003FCBFA66
DDDLTPSQTAGYKVGQEKTLAELANLDAEDESLQRWKASLGLAAGASAGVKKVIPQTLYLESPSLHKALVLDLTNAAALADLKKNPISIKEGVEYSVGVSFLVEGAIVSGLRYLHVVKRSGLKVDKTEKMIGSHGPQAEPHRRTILEEESPSGMLARSGSYLVRSRLTDDDGIVWLDAEWYFKLTKEW